MHTPGTTRPKKWRMASKPVPATLGVIERVLAQTKPGGSQLRRKKAKRANRRVRFAALPRADIFKAVRVAGAQLPPSVPGMLVSGPENPAIERPLLGRMVAVVWPDHAGVLGHRLIRPG